MAKIKLHPVIIFLLGMLAGAILVAMSYKLSVPGDNIENTILRNNIFIPNGIEAGTEDIFIPNGFETDVQTDPIFIPNGIY